MSPEEKELIKRTLTLAEENNEMIKSIRRSMRIASIVRVVYWVFIIGSAIGAYYLIQPYVEPLADVYGAFGGLF